MNHNLTIDLADGRRLGFAEYGDMAGFPVFYFHSFPGSRLEARQFHEIAMLENIRLIAIDRPGMGLSTFKKNRTVLSFASDVSVLADVLKIDEFSIMGHSAASVFIAACAFAISERVKSASIISGLAPLNLNAAFTSLSTDRRIVCKLMKILPCSAKLMMWLIHKKLKSSRDTPNDIGDLPEVDKRVFQDVAYRTNFMDTILESFREGSGGPAKEMQLICNPWGFNLREIRIPLTIWHGAQDTCVPPAHAKILAQHIPNSRLELFNEEGHLSILQREPIERIFNELTMN